MHYPKSWDTLPYIMGCISHINVHIKETGQIKDARGPVKRGSSGFEPDGGDLSELLENPFYPVIFNGPSGHPSVHRPASPTASTGPGAQ